MIRAMDALAKKLDSRRSVPEPHFSPDLLPTSEDLLHVARLVTIGELAACFAHEVMNPLTMIRGNLSIANYELPDDHPAHLYLEAIGRAERRIEELARRMLNFSKKRNSVAESHDVAEIVADAMRFMQPFFHEQDATIKTRIAPSLPRIEADRWQIVQALVNLLQNAAEAMLTMNDRTLTVSVTHEENDIRISIADTGRGIAGEDLPRIFTPFFTTKGDTGTGLGLYITRRIVDEHRGTITVETSTRGTTFTVSLPLPD
jgi:two-component system NtrC family sensor kinase